MLALIRPCGIVVSMTEIFTSESYTQIFFFILRTFCSNLEHFKRLRYLGYDSASGLMPFLKNQAQNGSAGAKLLIENPKCFYHPQLPKFDEIRGVNTEFCEQGFKRLNQYFDLTRKMSQFKRDVLFWFVNQCFDTDLEAELKRKKLL